MLCQCPRRAVEGEDVTAYGICAWKPFDHPLPKELQKKGVTTAEWDQVMEAGNKIEGLIGVSIGIFTGIVCGTIAAVASISKLYGLWGAVGLANIPNTFRYCMYPKVARRFNEDIFAAKGIEVFYACAGCSQGFGFSFSPSGAVIGLSSP